MSINITFFKDSTFNFSFGIKGFIGNKVIGFGVGGLIVYTNGRPLNEHKVLVYWRPNPVEQHKWSILGGRVEFNEDVRTALEREIRDISGLSLDSKGYIPLRITVHRNHPDDKTERYYFISPAYRIQMSDIHYNNIMSRMQSDVQCKTEEFIYSENITAECKKNLENVINSRNFFLKDWERSTLKLMKSASKQKQKSYIVRLASIEEITKCEHLYTSTTIQAVRSYVELYSEIIENNTECLNCKRLNDNFTF